MRNRKILVRAIGTPADKWWSLCLVAVVLLICIGLAAGAVYTATNAPVTNYSQPVRGEYVDVEIDGVTYTQFREENGYAYWVGDEPDLRTPEEKTFDDLMHNYRVGLEMHEKYPEAYGIFCFPWDYQSFGNPIPVAYFSKVWDAVTRNDLTGGQEALDQWYKNQVERWEFKQKVLTALPEYAAKLQGMANATQEAKEAEMLRLFLYQSGSSTNSGDYLAEVWAKCKVYPNKVDFATLYYTAKAVTSAASGDYIDLVTKTKVANVIANRLGDARYPGTVREVVMQFGQFPLGKGISDIEPSRNDVQAALNVLSLGEIYLEADVIFVGMYEQGEEVVETVKIEALNSTLYFCQ